MVLASKPGLSSSIDLIPSQLSSNGSWRVLHVWGCSNSLGSLPSLRYLRAVFSSIPALIAAIPKFFSVCTNLNNLLTCWSVTIQIAPFLQKFGWLYQVFQF